MTSPSAAPRTGSFGCSTDKSSTKSSRRCQVFARTTLLEIDTLRVSLEDAVAQFHADVLPALHEQPGFRGIYVFTTPAGRAMLISFWETAEQADASQASGWYPSVLADFTTMFRSPAGREHYEVRLAEPPAMADLPKG